MNERWQEIERIYHQALELQGSARAEFLAKTCAGNAGLRDEVESLLAQTSEAGCFSGGSHRQDGREWVR